MLIHHQKNTDNVRAFVSRLMQILSRAQAKPLTLLISAAAIILGLYAELLLAETPPPASEAKTYDIPAGPLGQQLSRFAVEAGILLTGDAALTDGHKSGNLKGDYSQEQALKILLEGTDLRAEKRDDGSYLIVGPKLDKVRTLAPVKVSAKADSGTATDAYRVKTASVGALGTADLQNTPYSVDVFSRDYMDNLQARSLSDLTKYDASISLSSGDLVKENNSL